MDATVTVIHSRSKNLQNIVRQADIIIAAIGSPSFVKADMVKDGAVVIDVGTTRISAPETNRDTDLPVMWILKMLHLNAHLLHLFREELVR